MAAQARPDAIARSDAPDSRESLLIGAPLLDAPELARRASPVTYVHAGAPPFHIAHGDADRFVPVGQSRQLADALRDGRRARSSSPRSRVATTCGWVCRDADAIFDAAVDFVRRVTAR